MDALVKQLEDLFSKAPALPVGGREFLVKIMPWLALIFGVLALLAGIGGLMAAIGLSTMIPYAASVNGVSASALTIGLWIGVIATIIYAIVLLVAFSPLKKRQIKGWLILFYLDVIWFVLSIVSAVLNMQLMSIVWALIWFAIGMYFLFQIKPHYK